MADNNIKLNRYCKYCGAELVVKDIREPKRIGFDEFTGKDKLSHREYFGVCPNRNKLFDCNHDTEWLCYDDYTRSYFYAGLYNYRDTTTNIFLAFPLSIAFVAFIIIIANLIGCLFNIS